MKRILSWIGVVSIVVVSLILSWWLHADLQTNPLHTHEWRFVFPYKDWWLVVGACMALLLSVRGLRSWFVRRSRTRRLHAYAAGWLTMLLALGLAIIFLFGPIPPLRFLATAFLLGSAMGEATLEYASWEDSKVPIGILSFVTSLIVGFLFGVGEVSLFDVGSLSMWFYTCLGIVYLAPRLFVRK